MSVPPFALVFSSLIFAIPTASHAAKLNLIVQDSNEEPLPCRVLLRTADGNCIVPKGLTTFGNGPDTWFVTNKPFTVDVPSGQLEVRVERGLEYVRIRGKVVVPAKGLTHKVTLRRWVDLRKLGYLCGENHIHQENLTDVGRMLAAEGMDFGTTLQWWDGPRIDVASGPAVRVLGWQNAKVPTSVYDAELEQAWGAAYLLNVPKRLDWKSDGGRPNLGLIREARKMGALINYNGGWDRECLLDAVLGYVDTVGICNNQFHMNRFQPRAQYSNLLNVPGFPTYPETPEGMLQLNTDTYYRLLNCGLKLAAGAGTASGVKQSPPGWNRTYAQCKAGSTYKDFCRAWAASRNFVTNGPIVFLSTSSGKLPGDTIALPAEGGKLRLRVRVKSEPTIALSTVEIVVNGEVAARITPRKNTASGEVDIAVKEGSWIAARCTASDTLLTATELEAYADRGGQLQLWPSNLRFAHTSPIYVTVGGRGAAVRKSLNESLLALDCFEDFGRKTANADEVDPLVAEIAKARAILKSRLH